MTITATDACRCGHERHEHFDESTDRIEYGACQAYVLDDRTEPDAPAEDGPCDCQRFRPVAVAA